MLSIFGIINWILSFFKPKTDAQTLADMAAKSTNATDVATEESAANAEESSVLKARTTADAVILQRDNGSPDAVTTDPHAPINTDPNAHFRD